MLLLDATWWWLLARLVERRLPRFLLALFMIAQMAGLIWLVFGRWLHASGHRWLPRLASSALFIWHFIGLGLLTLIGLALIPILIIRRNILANRRSLARGKLMLPEDQDRWDRRQFLQFAAALTPPIFTLSLTSVALRQLSQFRIRRFVLRIPDLPADLNGMTIAHVSDMHVGRFTSGRVLRKAVEAVNQMRADLVLLTGDLINDALVSLPEGLDLVRAMNPGSGLYLIEGNHDLIENGPEFERRVKASGIPFLLDESAIVNVRGALVQLLGLSWTRTRGRDRDSAISQSVRNLLRQRHADAFPILLAHHPHAFDAAIEAGLPLTLSGHTHGGQLMLNEHLGFGPAMFRYWSGLYYRGRSQLIVSNGVGNWFPLRTRASAELVHITLRRA